MDVSGASTGRSESTQELERRLRDRTARVVVLGLGFAGLPQTVEFARAGYPTVGLDVDAAKVARLRSGEAPLDPDLRRAIADGLRTGALEVTTDPDSICGADCAIVCVPTPLRDGDPDLAAVSTALRSIASRLDGIRLVVVESTLPPGATREVAQPILEEFGRRVGSDVFLAYAPERIDPGNSRFGVRNTPRLVAGITPRCRELASLLYSAIVERVEPLSTVETAEMAKVVENAFLFVNISFANEMAMFCNRMGIDVWDVIGAAATKPYGFMPHYPGPGVGGACIPVVPFYVRPRARELGLRLELVEQAGRINARMPEYVVERVAELLSDREVSLLGARVLAIGVTYKPDVADLRGSPSLQVVETLLARGARVEYADPLVDRIVVGSTTLHSVALTAERLADVDCAVVLTAHRSLDYGLLVERCRLVFDTRNALAAWHSPNVVRL